MADGMSGENVFPQIKARGVLHAAAAACFVAALAVGLAAARLPATAPQPRIPAPPATSPAAPDPARERSRESPAETEISAREQELFKHAEVLRESGKLKEAEAIYLVLLQRGQRRDEAAWKLGELYMRAKSYRRAKEMFGESARLLREKSN